jgi:hypothetical protein
MAYVQKCKSQKHTKMHVTDWSWLCRTVSVYFTWNFDITSNSDTSWAPPAESGAPHILSPFPLSLCQDRLVWRVYNGKFKVFMVFSACKLSKFRNA